MIRKIANTTKVCNFYPQTKRSKSLYCGGEGSISCLIRCVELTKRRIPRLNKVCPLIICQMAGMVCICYEKALAIYVQCNIYILAIDS